MLSLGWQEMAVIFILALVLFGPRKLPELGKTIGKAITEFRRASNELKSTFDREMQAIERENESIKDTAQKYLDDATGSTGSDSYYDSSYYDSEAYGSQDYGSGTATASVDSSSASNTTSSVGEPAIQGAELTPAASESAAAALIAPAEGTVARGAQEALGIDAAATAAKVSPETGIAKS